MIQQILDKAVSVKKFLKRFTHDYLGWHKPERSNIYTDGLSLVSVCKICGKKILMDSQGNWFVSEIFE